MVGRFLALTVGDILILGDRIRWIYLADGVVGVMALLVALQLPRLNAAESQRGDASTQPLQS